MGGRLSKDFKQVKIYTDVFFGKPGILDSRNRTFSTSDAFDLELLYRAGANVVDDNPNSLLNPPSNAMYTDVKYIYFTQKEKGAKMLRFNDKINKLIIDNDTDKDEYILNLYDVDSFNPDKQVVVYNDKLTVQQNYILLMILLGKNMTTITTGSYNKVKNYLISSGFFEFIEIDSYCGCI